MDSFNSSIKKRSTSMFSKLDIFGSGFNFLVNGNDKVQTSFGSWFTIFYFFTFVGLFFGFGVDLYQRKKPKVSFNSKIEDYTRFSLSNSNYTYAFRVEDTDGVFITDESIVYQEILYFSYEMENGAWDVKFINLLKPKRCNDVPLVKEKEQKYNISLNSWYCIDFDNVTMGGNWEGNFVYGLQIVTRQCTNSTTRNNCRSKENIEKAFRNERTSSKFFYSDLSLEVLPTMDDFEKPLKTNLVNRYQLLNLGLSKRNIYTNKITSINDDKGWFFQELITSSIFSNDNIFSDFTLKDTWTQDILFNQFIYFGKKFDVYNRGYTKVQEVLASMGGFTKFTLVLINIIYIYVNRKVKNLLLLSEIPFKQEDFNLGINKLNSNNDLQKVLFRSSKNEEALKSSGHNPILHKQPDKLLKHNTPSGFIVYNQNNLINNPQFAKFKNSALRSKSRILKAPKLSFIDFCCFKFGVKPKDPVASKMLKMYKIYESYFHEVINIFNYYKLHNEFSNLKKVILNDKEEQMFNTIPHDVFKYEKDSKIENVPIVNSNYQNLSRNNNNSENLRDDKMLRICNMVD